MVESIIIILSLFLISFYKVRWKVIKKNIFEPERKNMIGGNNESFFSYMFSLSQKDKMEMMNIVQYIGLAFIPIVLLVYCMKLYLPSFDPYKGNIEILVEVLIQLVVLIIFFGLFIVLLCSYLHTVKKIILL